VKVAGDPLPVLDEDHLGQASMEAGILDGDAGGTSQSHHKLLVNVAEDLGGRLIGQVEVAEDLVADPDRDSEERVHRRVVRREPVAVGMLFEVGEAQRLGIQDQQTEDALPMGQVADGLVGLVIEPHGEELRELGLGLVEHAEGAVASVNQLHGGGHDPVQDRRQIKAGTDRHDGVEKLAERPGTGVLRHAVTLGPR